METGELPVEVITQILNFLPIPDRKEASLVNRSWYFAARDSLRQEESIFYKIPATSASLGTIKSLSRRRVWSIQLTNLDSSSTSREVIGYVGRYLGPYLRRLCLRGSSVTESLFEELLFACPCLTALDLSGCNSFFMLGTLLSKEEALLRAQEALGNLRELNLSGVQYLSDLTFSRLTGCAPRLAKLSLARCHIAFDGSYSNSSALLSFRNLLDFVGSRAGSVTALDLSGTSISRKAIKSLVKVENLRLQEMVLQECREISDEVVDVLCRHQPCLVTLDLSGCFELNDRAVLTLCSRLPELRCLKLGKLPWLLGDGFQGVSHLKHLQSLDVPECNFAGFDALVKALGGIEPRPRLVSLNVAFCNMLRDSSVISLARALNGSLRVLDLSSCFVTDRSIQAIATHLLNLTVLRLASCKELTDWGLLGVEQPREAHEQSREKDAGPKFSRNFGNMGFFLPPPHDLELDIPILADLAKQEGQQKNRASLTALSRLQELDLTACGKLTDTSISKVISFPELRRLSLSQVPNITDASLKAVARHCRSLERLSLSHCVNLTDGGFTEAVGTLPRLQHLVLSGCNQLTSRTLKAVSQECRQLKSLDISSCSGIGMADVELFQSRLPQTSIHSRFVGGADLSVTL